MKIFSQAPCRLGLFGGGTDIEPYASSHGGIVINMAINLRQKMTLFSENDIFAIPKNVFPPGANPEFYYKIWEEFKVNGGHHTRIKCEFDGIVESGLGSSAAAAVAIVGAINKQQNLRMTLQEIAEKAWDIEVNKIGLYGGKQDQYAAAFGGVNVLEFSEEGVKVTPLARGFVENLIPSLGLFYTGQNRKSAVIQEEFKKLTSEKIASFNQIKKLAVDAIDPISRGDVETVGRFLDIGWQLKKQSNKGATNKKIDEIYEYALKNGALGGKAMGAGGGGFMFFVCPPEKKAGFIEAMKDKGLEWWDFSADFQGLDVRILP